MSIHNEVFYRFFEKNRGIVSAHIILTLVSFPLEILVLSYISGIIFKRLEDKNFKRLFLVLIVFFVFFLFIEFCHFLQEYMSSLIIPRLDTFTRTELLDIVLNHSFEQEELKIGEVMHRLSKMPGHIYKNYSNMINSLVPLCLSILFFLGYLFWIHWKIALVAAVLLLLLLVVYLSVFYRLAQNSEYRFVYEHELMDMYEDTIANWESIRMANTYTDEKRRMIDKSDTYEKLQQKDIHTVNILKVSSIVIFNIIMILLLCMGIVLAVWKKDFPYWKLIIFITAIFLVTRTVSGLLSKCCDSIYHYGSIHQFSVFLKDFQNKKIDSREESENKITRHSIEFHNVRFRYNTSEPYLLDTIKLSIPFRSSLLIVGTVGSGKSTLVKMIAGFLHPTEGTVTIDDIPVHRFSTKYLMNHVTYMNQDVLLFNRTILENIFYGNVPIDERALQEMTFLPAKIRNNLHKSVGKYGEMLSGGERQIVFLLRVYFKPAPIVLLDEPTANLDPTSREDVLYLISLMMKEKTVVCITHDNTLARYFQKVYLLQHGKLVSQTKPNQDNLFTNYTG